MCEDIQADVEDGQLQFFYILAFVLQGDHSAKRRPALGCGGVVYCDTHLCQVGLSLFFFSCMFTSQSGGEISWLNMSTSGEAAAVCANYALPSRRCFWKCNCRYFPSVFTSVYNVKGRKVEKPDHKHSFSPATGRKPNSWAGERGFSHGISFESVFRTLMVSVHAARVNKQPIVWSFCVLAASLNWFTQSAWKCSFSYFLNQNNIQGRDLKKNLDSRK